MDIENISIGTDIEQISRFKNKSIDCDKDFLERIFTQTEIDYSFSKNFPAQHLCARFCAKEAVVKALSDFGINDVFYNDIEVTNCEDGHPVAVINKYPNFIIKISLSHNSDAAVATALILKIKNK